MVLIKVVTIVVDSLAYSLLISVTLQIITMEQKQGVGV
jgi:hypothetical protein